MPSYLCPSIYVVDMVKGSRSKPMKALGALSQERLSQELKEVIRRFPKKAEERCPTFISFSMGKNQNNSNCISWGVPKGKCWNSAWAAQERR